MVWNNNISIKGYTLVDLLWPVSAIIANRMIHGEFYVIYDSGSTSTIIIRLLNTVVPN